MSALLFAVVYVLASSLPAFAQSSTPGPAATTAPTPISGPARTIIPLPTVTAPVSPLVVPLSSNRPETTPEAASDVELTVLDTGQFDETLIQAQIDALLDARVEAWLTRMPAEDRVGQLFVVNFVGSETGIESDIAVLIHGYRVGGVVISPRYENFTNQKDAATPQDVAALVNRLQALAYGYLLTPEQALPSESDMAELIAGLPTLGASMREADRSPLNIPLFVAVEQVGDSVEHTYLRQLFTPLPTQMALGAAWEPGLTRRIGEIVGRELDAVGANLLMGPNLDVLVQPRPDAVGALGLDMFGGDPFWVSEMGAAYVSGIHSGSGGRVLTAARHFPGQGLVDRLPDEDVAIIQAPIDELQAVALPPFQAVTGAAPGVSGTDAVTDLMMPSNVRYSSIEGTGVGRISPLSQSLKLESFIDDEGFGPWRDSGLLMTSALGLPTLRRHNAGESPETVARSLAQNAFYAGNNLLYLGQYGQDGLWETEMANILSTIGFFQEQYQGDSNFAALVDAAVRPILRAKLRLFYPEEQLRADALALLNQAAISVTLPLTQPVTDIDPGSGVTLPGSAPDVPLRSVLTPAESLSLFVVDDPNHLDGFATVRQVARESITVLYPDISLPGSALPLEPQAGDQILIFTDSRLFQECADCTAEVAVGPEEMEEIILRLYGQEGTGQILDEDITSLTFSELVETLALDTDSADAQTGDDVPLSSQPGAPLTDEPADGLTDAPPVEGTAESSVEQGEQDPVEAAIENAEWIIFNMLDVDPEAHPASEAVKLFLRERPGQVNGKQIVVLALHAPYYLDATEISQLRLYLGVYAHSQPFLENAVRVLFRSYSPTGAPPVSVAGTRFSSLSDRLSADPDIPLPLAIYAGDEEILPEAEGDPLPIIQVGRSIRIQVGPILDENGHVVPDGTEVDFVLTYDDTELAMTIPPSETRDGVALRDVPLERSGILEIAARSGLAETNGLFRLRVADSGSADGQNEAAVPVPPTTVAEEDEPIADSTPLPTEEGASDASPNVVAYGDHANPVTLLVALFTMLITLSLLLIVQVRILPRSVLVHNLLWGVVVGLGAYVAYAVKLIPGAEWLYGIFGVWTAGLIVFLGMIIPMLWLQLRAVRD